MADKDEDGEIADDGFNSSYPRKPRPSLLQIVQVLYNGKMKEMTETSGGQWTTDSWTHVKPSTLYDPTGHCYKYAVFQLILEFKDTSFAEGERRVLTHLSNLLDTQSMSDVTFIVKNEKIGAHSAIVVSGSPVICAMLEKENFKEVRTKVVEIDDIDPAVFK